MRQRAVAKVIINELLPETKLTNKSGKEALSRAKRGGRAKAPTQRS
jgi:hypothetical protein